MAAPSTFPAPLRLLAENPEAVLQELRQGYVDAVDWSTEQVVDAHILCALQSGLLAECARDFPDPRLEPEIPVLVLLTASVAAAFQGEYALCEAGCALHSPALLAQLGMNAAWLCAGQGLSRRGTQEEALFHPDTLRKLLLQIAELDRQAGRRPGESLLNWWNETVGPAFLRRVESSAGPWILDTTKLLVNLANPRYEGSDLTKDEDDHPQRGYKLGLLSALVDEGRLIAEVAWDTARAADVTLARSLLAAPRLLEAKDKLLHDRGILDANMVSCLKRDLGVDTVFPLKSEMLAYRLAIFKVEERPHCWEPHPTRQRQEIQAAKEIGGPWEECAVPLNACVVREWQNKEGKYRYWVFASTELERSGRGIIRDYEARSECEEDHRQTKGRDWEMDEFTSTTLVEILYHVIVVLFAYNLCQFYAHTQAGQRYARQTKRARLREQRRRGVRVVVVAGDCYAILTMEDFTLEVLALEGEPKHRLQAKLQDLLAARMVSG